MNGDRLRVGIFQSWTASVVLSEKLLVDTSLMATAQINEQGSVLRLLK